MARFNNYVIVDERQRCVYDLVTKVRERRDPAPVDPLLRANKRTGEVGGFARRRAYAAAQYLRRCQPIGEHSSLSLPTFPLPQLCRTLESLEKASTGAGGPGSKRGVHRRDAEVAVPYCLLPLSGHARTVALRAKIAIDSQHHTQPRLRSGP